MSTILQKLISKTLEQFAGSGVRLDDAGRIALPDGLDADRVHCFIELVLEQRYESPKAALHQLFERVGVAPSAVGAMSEILGDRGELDFSALASSPFRLSLELPRMLEIPRLFRRFLVEDLGLGDPKGATLEEAVASTRQRAAALLGCAPKWDAILARRAELSELARPWRESFA